MRALNGRVAIIVGGTSGIGACTARLFAHEGARVCIAGRREVEGRQVASSIAEGTEFYQLDATSEVELATLVQSVAAKHGRLDCMMNNAGGPVPVSSVEQLSSEEMDGIIRKNLYSVAFGIKHAAKVMRRQGFGSIINTASIAGSRAGIATHSYSAAKAGVIHLSRCAAVELGEVGVRVNSLSPGVTLTDSAVKELAISKAISVEEAQNLMRESLAKLQPIPRAATAEDVACAALFLASDASEFISGQDLVVDGGFIGGWKWSELVSG